MVAALREFTLVQVNAIIDQTPHQIGRVDVLVDSAVILVRHEQNQREIVQQPLNCAFPRLFRRFYFDQFADERQFFFSRVDVVENPFADGNIFERNLIFPAFERADFVQNRLTFALLRLKLPALIRPLLLQHRHLLLNRLLLRFGFAHVLVKARFVRARLIAEHLRNHGVFPRFRLLRVALFAERGDVALDVAHLLAGFVLADGDFDVRALRLKPGDVASERLHLMLHLRQIVLFAPRRLVNQADFLPRKIRGNNVERLFDLANGRLNRLIFAAFRHNRL